MDQLKDAVAAAFDNIVASGAIEAALQEQVGKAITSAIKDQINGYNSEFSKKITERVKALVDVDLDAIDLPSYRQLIADVIVKRVGAVMSTEFTEKLDKDIAALLEPAPAEITLEVLLADFVEVKMDAYNADELRGNEFTLHIERDTNPLLASSKYVHVYISEDPRTTKYSCDIQLDLRGDGEIWGIKIGGKAIKDQLFVGPLFSFEKRLFQMYTSKTRLIVPADASADDYTTTFPYND